MRSDHRTLLASVAALTLLVGSASFAAAAEDEALSSTTPTVTTTPTPVASAPTPTPSASASSPAPTATPTAPVVPDDAFTVDDAQLRWGLNAESNRAAFAPGTYNFLSAGKIADPGRGGVTLTESGWRQRSGEVHVEKYLASSSTWRPATWSGLSTDSEGTRLTVGRSTSSNHQVVVDGGTGTVDPSSGTATIRWRGSFTVLYYSGFSFFYVSDPVLTVKGGTARVTGTLSGFGSSMEDQTRWERIAPVKNVVLADLGRVDLGTDLGFTSTPRYRGVKATVASGQTQQLRSGSSWGSFPQSFVDYQTRSGTGSYWYSSGGSADPHKIASPLTISYAAGKPVRTARPSTTDTAESVTNELRVRPPSASQSPASPRQASAQAPAVRRAPSTAPVASGTLADARPVSTVLGVARQGDPRSGPTALWIAGAIVLLLAALVAASPSLAAAVADRRDPSRS